MDAIADTPQAIALFEHRLTGDRARELSAKAVEARRINRENREKELETLRARVAELEQRLKETTPLQTRVQDVERQIEKLNEELAEPQDAKAWQALTSALDKLYNVWALLTGHERPGIRKSTKPRKPTFDIPTPDA